MKFILENVPKIHKSICFSLFGKKRLSKIQKKIGPLNFNASGNSLLPFLIFLVIFFFWILQVCAGITQRDLKEILFIGRTLEAKMRM